MATLRAPISTRQERVKSISVSSIKTPSDFQVVYSIKVSDLTPEDVILIKSQAEFTNNLGYTVSFGRYLLRAPSPTEVIKGVQVTRPVYMSFSPGQHHYVAEYIGVDYMAPEGTYYYNVVAYAYTKRAKPGDTLIVEQGYGDCTAMVFDRSSPRVPVN